MGKKKQAEEVGDDLGHAFVTLAALRNVLIKYN
jgi:hypothetical protein